MRFLTAILIILSNLFLYSSYLSKNFGYMGYDDNGLTICNAAGIIIYSIIPVFWRVNKDLFNQIFFTLYYVILYIPIVVAYGFLYDCLDYFYRVSFIFVGFYTTVAVLNSSWKISVIKRVTIPKLPTLKILCIGQLLVLLILYLSFRESLSFVQFEEVYEKRSDLKYNYNILGYFVLWTSYFLAPLLIILGRLNRLSFLVYLGFVSSFFVYGISGAKIVFFIPFLILFIVFLSDRKLDIFKSVGLSFSVLIILGVYFANSIGAIGAVLLQRTFGNSGLLTYQYAEFFRSHPYTLYSHNSLISRFIEYPYDKELGFIVFDFFTNPVGVSESNSNANFLATDGYAAFGNFGVLIISLFVGLYLKFTVNQFSKEQKLIAPFILLPFLFMLLNVSFFTCILSGGWIFMNLTSFVKSDSL